jgi:hypothetical protein
MKFQLPFSAISVVLQLIEAPFTSFLTLNYFIFVAWSVFLAEFDTCHFSLCSTSIFQQLLCLWQSLGFRRVTSLASFDKYCSTAALLLAIVMFPSGYFSHFVRQVLFYSCSAFGNRSVSVGLLLSLRSTSTVLQLLCLWQSQCFTVKKAETLCYKTLRPAFLKII